MAKCSKFSPSDLDKRVEVQQEAKTDDGQGGYTSTWSTIGTVWAQIKPVSAYERMQGMQLAAPRTHNITLRYAEWITEDMRLVYQERIFAIKEILNVDEANFFLTLKCVEG